jgi:photosystem II stability/assembly factor-like uncharacterized protein
MTKRMANRKANFCRFAFRLLVSVILPTLALAPLPVVAAWQGTGPFGGAAEIVRTVPKVSGLVVAGAHNGLIYVSRNGGAYWSNVPFPGQFAGVLHSLEVDPRSESTWYAGMESENQWTSGVYKTSDAGRTWTLLPDMRGIGVWSIALWSKNPDIIAAGTSSGVYLSKDAGTNWSHISSENDPELKPVVSLAFHPTDSNTIFAGTTHLPWRTVNGGASWQSIHSGMIDDSDVFSIQVDPLKPNRVFASACSGVYGSTDGAELWSKLDTPKGAFRTYFVAIDPKHDEVVFAGTTEGLMRSADGGRTWRKVDSEAIKSVAFDPFVPGRVFFASTTAGLMLSTDGGNTLRETNYGFTNRNFTTLTGAGNYLYSSSVYEPVSGGVYRSDNLGLRWVHAGGPPADQVLLMAAVPENPKVLFGAGYRALLESQDAAKTWTAYRNQPPGTKITAILPVSATALFVGTDRGLFRTSDGASWTSLSGARVDSIARSGNQILLALTGTGALQSADAGATWKKCGDPQPATTWYGLAFDPATPNIALSATAAGLFRSTDGCISWTPVHDGLPAATASIVLFHPKRPREAYVAQGGKVFRSTDGGQRWLSLEDDANGNSGPSSLFVLPEVPDRLFALFPRRGVFSTPVPGTTPGAPESTSSNRAQPGGPVAGSSDFARHTVTNKSHTTKEKTVQ